MKFKVNKLKNAVCKTINTLVACVFFFTSKRYREHGDSLFSILRNIMYSEWESLRLGARNVRFGYPINSIRGCKYIKIGEDSSFGRYVVLTAWDKINNMKYSPQIIIGTNCNFGDFLNLTSTNIIEIGNNVLTGRWVTITDNSHGESIFQHMCLDPEKRPVISKGKITIRDNVWIGDKVTILAGVTIGEGCIIGANSVITKDIPPYCVAVGIPAKVIKSVKNGCFNNNCNI